MCGKSSQSFCPVFAPGQRHLATEFVARPMDTPVPTSIPSYHLTKHRPQPKIEDSGKNYASEAVLEMCDYACHSGEV
jgi:hypothetical protein